MESSETKPNSNFDKDLSQSVRVAVNIRPLITPELLNGCTDCINVVPGEPQVQIGSHAFTFDYVYGSKASPPSAIFDDCVAPLVEALFHGYNATVLAYGQTGSGKTFTMGTNYNGQENNGGIIPKVMETIFKKVDQMKDSSEFLIRVSFIEIFKEEVFDLLDTHSLDPCKSDGVASIKPVAPRAPIQIRETVSGGITLAGVTEAEVKTKEEMASFLSQGSSSRATASTNMNSQSSRSHAIFTITMVQKKVPPPNGSCNGEIANDYLCSKLHLVDLAGSERAKRTGADGMRFKEGIHINKGLLALGNVISALGDEKKRKEGAFVPYRDSKLTRLLQDSLGGNSKTVMIACVSPADTNAEETLNTLKYANRARNIQNKAVINRDPVADQLQRMRSQLEQLQTELLFYKGDAGGQYEELQILKHKVSLLEASNMELRRELQARQMSCEHLTQRAIDAQVEKDKLIMMIESARNGKTWDEIDSKANEDENMIKSYVAKIQELEGELLRLRNLNDSKYCTEWTESNDDGPHAKTSLLMCGDDFSLDSGLSDDNGVREKELEHSSLKETLDKELKELDQRLEEKEAEMRHFANSENSILRQHYEKKILEAEHEKKALMNEIQVLMNKISSISSACDDGAQKLKEEYLQKLNALEAQVSELKKKQDAQSQLLRQKQKSDEAARRLQDEIQRIKSQKVQLQHKIKQESESFRLWKAAREKEVLQLKKEGRRNEYEMHKLLALNQRQKMVLQRKTEEASMVTKRLKELLESRKRHGMGPGIQALMQVIEHELEVVARVHEVRSQYDRQMEERARMAKEIARLKDEAQVQTHAIMSKYPQAMSPGARNSRIFALENMLATSSSCLVSMASQLSEAEERERESSGKGRWNQVRSLGDAKNLMNYLFTLASNSRCLLQDKEADCREKDAEIKDLKEKVVKLNGVLRQLEMQNAELISQVKSQSMLLKGHPRDQVSDFGCGESDIISLSHKDGLREPEYQSPPEDDMDTDSDVCDDENDEDYDPKEDGWKNYKDGRRPSAESLNSHLKPEAPCEQPESMIENSEKGCTCSKTSQCKTSKCACKGAGDYCGESCGCVSSKCSNRQSHLEDSELLHLKNEELADQEKESNQPASDYAKLLENAMSGDGSKRRPLADIGNTLAKQNVPKPNRRKTWRSQTVQIVAVAPPSSVQPETTTTTEEQEEIATERERRLRLPAAMRTAAIGNRDPLRERNADPSDGPSISKENTAAASRSPSRHLNTSDEKENHE